MEALIVGVLTAIFFFVLQAAFGKPANEFVGALLAFVSGVVAWLTARVFFSRSGAWV